MADEQHTGVARQAIEAVTPVEALRVAALAGPVMITVPPEIDPPGVQETSAPSAAAEA